MTKIERNTQKIFGGNAPADDIAALGSFKTGTPVYTDDISTLQNAAYEQGYGATLVANEAPFMEEQNSVPYILSKQLAYTFQEGIPEYDASTTYYKGSIVKILDENNVPVLYYSLTENNFGNPLTDETNWQEFYSVSDADYVKTTGDTMTGDLTISKPNPNLNFRNTTGSYYFGVNFYNNQFSVANAATLNVTQQRSGGRVAFMDEDNNFTGWIQQNLNTDNSIHLDIGNRMNINGTEFNNGISIQLNKDGTCYVVGPTPAANSNTNQFTTTEWVRSHSDFPSNRADNITIGVSGARYTALANGFFCYWCQVDNKAASYMSWIRPSYGGQISCSSEGYSLGGAVVPVSKGQSITLDYQENVIKKSLKFVYSQGDA